MTHMSSCGMKFHSWWVFLAIVMKIRGSWVDQPWEVHSAFCKCFPCEQLTILKPLYRYAAIPLLLPAHRWFLAAMWVDHLRPQFATNPGKLRMTSAQRLGPGPSQISRDWVAKKAESQTARHGAWSLPGFSAAPCHDALRLGTARGADQAIEGSCSCSGTENRRPDRCGFHNCLVGVVRK